MLFHHNFWHQITHKKMNMMSIPFLLGLAVLLQGALASLQLHHRRLSPSESIIAALDSQLASGIAHPHFTITANPSEGENLFAPTTPFEISVALTKSSVTEETSFSIDGGESAAVTSNVQFLVSAEDERNDGQPPAFAILAVDRDSNTVSGLVQKDGKLVKLEQLEGGQTTATEVDFIPPKDWACTVVHGHDKSDEGGRRLQDDEQQHHHEHIISRDLPSNLSMLDSTAIQHRRKAYATDTFPNKWTYQVDLYIEVDDALVNKHDPSNTVTMPNTVTYVNALITAVSSIYEREIDTHCEYNVFFR
jgi:hypothetical protein